jgi:hypothetical protein
MFELRVLHAHRAGILPLELYLQSEAPLLPGSVTGTSSGWGQEGPEQMEKEVHGTRVRQQDQEDEYQTNILSSTVAGQGLPTKGQVQVVWI